MAGCPAKHPLCVRPLSAHIICLMHVEWLLLPTYPSLAPFACLAMRLLCVVVVLQLWTTDLLMMRKAQDRAGLHGGLGGLQGMKGLAGFGATLASNKFVRAAIREDVRWSIPQSVPLVPLVSFGSG